MAYSVSNDSVLLGNDLKASDGTTAITLTDSTGAVATAGAVSAGGDVTLASGKDLVLQGGGYIKAGSSGTLFKNSSDTTVLSSSGGDIAVSANLGVTGDLTVTGNDIKDSSAATCLTFSSGAVSTGAALTTGGAFTVNSSSTTTFGGVAYTWPASDAASSGYVLKSNSLGTLSWGADDAGGITASRKTASFSAAAGNFYLCDASSTIEVTLPTPSTGNRIIFKAGASVSGSVIIKLKAAAAADKIDGAAYNVTPLNALVAAHAAVELVACDGDGLGTIEWFIV